MEEGFPAAEEPEPYELSPQERRDVEADLEDLGKMHDVFSPQGVKGVVIACQDCGQNHFYEWDLLQDNLEHMLDTGEPRMHEPAFNIHEDEYIQWDYGKGYVDALADAGLQTGRTIEVTQCPWCGTPFDAGYQYCPRCGRQLGAIRLYQELLDRGIEDREARAMLARAGYEPF
jgi:predicted nucleic-acid-binding Zn-ribbon protein